MSFDTEKRKLYSTWLENDKNNLTLRVVKNNEVLKSEVVERSLARNNVFNNFPFFETDWTPLLPNIPVVESNPVVVYADFEIEYKIPQHLWTAVRLVHCCRVQPAGRELPLLYALNRTTHNRFCYHQEDKVRWVIGTTQTRSDDEPYFYDLEIKFMLWFINPYYFTNS